DLLPPSAALLGRALGGRVAARLPLRDQGEPLPHPHQAPARPRPRPRAVLRADRAARGLAEARAGAVAAPRELPPGRRAPRDRPGPPPARPPLLRVPRCELVRSRRPRPPSRAR